MTQTLVPRPATTVPYSAWLAAFRLRTLPLSLATIATGGFLAGVDGAFNWAVFTLSIATTLFLQILSNLANDYGDTVHGADSAERVGPERAVQSGAISLAAMKRAISAFALLAFVSGIALIFVAFGVSDMFYPVLFLLLGLGAIAAAIKYTAGKNPYGYKGLGDIFVFLFFGIVGVGGSYFLHTQQFNPAVLLPAASVGLLSAGVLNVNNMRDRISDEKAGKRTLAVKMGPKRAKLYHLALIGDAWLVILIYTFTNFRSPLQFMYLVTLPLFVMHLVKIFQNTEPALLDGQLKTLALSTFAYCITFGVSQLIA